MHDLEQRICILERKVQELQDRNEIEQLRFKYHVAVNDKRPDAIKDLFVEDGVVDLPDGLGAASGPTEIGALFEKLLLEYAPFVKHFIHNHVIEINGDRATGFAYLEAKPVINGISQMAAGRYDDEYVRVNGEWKLKKMRYVNYYTVPLNQAEGLTGPARHQ